MYHFWFEGPPGSACVRGGAEVARAGPASDSFRTTDPAGLGVMRGCLDEPEQSSRGCVARPFKTGDSKVRTKARILIVPEEGSDARGLEECLQGFGYAVCGPASDRQALQNALEMRPDLALVDLGLEGDVDGIEAAREIRTTGVPVVYLTDGAEEELQRAEETQPFGYVLKPFSEGQLHLNIRTALFMGERESRHRTLAHQKQLMEAVFDSMDEGVVVGDAQGRLILENPRMEGIVGFGIMDIDPSEWSETYGAFYLDGETQVPTDELPLVRAMRGETFDDMEVFVRNANKPEGVYVRVSGRPLLDDSEEIKAGVVVFRDVTQQKLTERAQKQAIARMEDHRILTEAVFDSISDGVVAANEDGEFTIFNPSAERIVGLGMLQASPDQWTDRYGIYYPDKETHIPTEELPLVRAMRGETTDEMELFIRNEKKPEGIYISVSGRPLQQDGKRHGGGVIAFRDVTHHKEAEAKLAQTMEELRNQSELMETTFNSISDGIVVADEKGSFLHVNPAAEEIVGMGATDTPQDDWAEKYGTFYPDRKTPVETRDLPLLRAIFAGESTDDEDLFIRNEARPEGIYIRVSGRPLLNQVGGVRGGMVVFRDVTEQVVAEEALALAFAQGRLEVVDTILHNIGNAINSVTTGIDTVREHLIHDRLVGRLFALTAAIEAHQDDWIDYLENDPQGQKVLPFIVGLSADFGRRNEELIKTIGRVRDRANHIADIVRTQKAIGTSSVLRKDIDLRSALSGAVRMLHDSLSKRSIRTSIECEEAPGEIRIQESQFHQMLVNLIKNSAEAIDELAISSGLQAPPRIRIRAYMKEDYFYLEVIDNGVGFALKNPKVLFAAGYSTKRSGSGLGLHSVANFVIGAGGQIHALSDGIGQGATMRVMLRRSSIVPPSPGDGG